MSGSDTPLSFTVHNVSPATLDESVRRTARGRLKMLMILAVCAAPVVASYLTYFVIRPQARTNYSTLIDPQRPIPQDLPLTDLQGAAVPATAITGHWLLVAVSAGACDVQCEKNLWIQRQLREALGAEKDRVQKVWLITDGQPPRPAALQAVTTNTAMRVLQVPEAALAAWLQPQDARRLSDHLYVVDPLGHWMMRVPPQPDPARLKRDIEKLLRASAGWDRAAS